MRRLRLSFWDGYFSGNALDRIAVVTGGALGLGYQSEWAQAHLPSRRERNEFYTKVGYKVKPGKASLDRLKQLEPTLSPGDILANCGG